MRPRRLRRAACVDADHADELEATEERSSRRVESRAQRVASAAYVGTWRTEDDTAGPLHDGRDPFRRAVRDGSQRVVLQMSIVLGGSGLTMPKYLADEVEAVAARIASEAKLCRRS